MRFIQHILFWIGLYVYLYNPILKPLGFGAIKILLAVSILYFFFSYRRVLLFFQLFSREIFFLLGIVLYIYALQFWGRDVSLSNAYIHVIWFLEGFFIPLFLVSIFGKGLDIEGWKSKIIIAGIAASFITIFLIASPGVNDFIKQNIIIDAFELAEKGSTITFRSFAIAEGSTFPYGIIQGMIIGLCLTRLKRNLILAVPIITLFVSILFNARIGLAPVLVGLGLVIVLKQINAKVALSFVLIALLGGWFFVYSDFAQRNEEGLYWGISAFEQIIGFLQGEDGGTVSTITKDMVFFPKTDAGLLFGEGRDLFVYQFDIQNRSDVGYVRQIFFGGLVFLTIMLLYLLYMVYRYVKITNDLFFGLLFLFTVLICNQKGYLLFVSTGVFRMFTLLYVAAILHAHGRHYVKDKING